jgi:glyoxylase-like metal-dependent hydrolase (beta-lactamase superfamily II)
VPHFILLSWLVVSAFGAFTDRARSEFPAAPPPSNASPAQAARSGAEKPRTPRLYVFDCGTLDVADTGRFRLKREEVSTDKLSVGCYLVAHPRGTLIWDTGAVPDSLVQAGGKPIRYRIALPGDQERFVTLTKTLKAQLAETGYRPADITHVALSHYHYDHSANTNDFASATWLVRQVERDAMFAAKPPDLVQPSSYSALRGSKTVIIKTDDYDVFGDGTVVIKFAPGHTPGHQVLSLKLANTGRVVLAGDLYHYPEERRLGRIPTFDDNQEQTAKTRVALDAFLKQNNAQLWIQHDFRATATLKKAPQYYD